MTWMIKNLHKDIQLFLYSQWQCTKIENISLKIQGGIIKYLQADNTFRDDTQTAQSGRIICQAFSIDGEVLVKWSHGKGMHNLQGHKDRIEAIQIANYHC